MDLDPQCEALQQIYESLTVKKKGLDPNSEGLGPLNEAPSVERGVRTLKVRFWLLKMRL